MGTTTFSGPIKAGTIKETTGTTLKLLTVLLMLSRRLIPQQT
jgi:hypothetical protein